MTARSKKSPKSTEIAPTRISDMDLVRERLTELAEDRNRLDPHDVVQEARDPSSVLHPFFTWDDDAASEKFRLLQAGVLIRRVKITIIRQDPETKALSTESVRALQSPASERDTKTSKKGGSFIPSSRIAGDPGLRAALVATVWKELDAVRKRYKEVAELAAVWTAIEAAKP